MKSPSVQLAKDVAQTLTSLDRVDARLIIGWLERLRSHPHPSAGERFMATPPSRYIRTVPNSEWHVGYDVSHTKGELQIISLEVQELRVWFIGGRFELELLLHNNDVRFELVEEVA